MLLYGLLIADGVLLLLALIAAAIRFCKKSDEDIKQESETNKILEQEQQECFSDKEPEPELIENSELSETVETAVAEQAVAVAEQLSAPELAEREEKLIIGDVEDDLNGKKAVPFSVKMLSLDKKTQDYYDIINNAFLSCRRIHGRVSQKCVSYRLGRDLIAKISVRGKTLRLNLALEPKEYEEKLYFQKDMRDVKAYQEVPLMVKIKSDRGLKRALELIDALSEKEKIEKKARYFPVDSIGNLNSLKK